MRRVSLLAALVVALATVTAAPAVADDPDTWELREDVESPGNSGSAPGRGGRSGNPHLSLELGQGRAADGGNCWYIGVTWEAGPQDAGEAARVREQYDEFINNPGGLNGPDGQPRADSSLDACPGGAIDVGAVAESLWLQVIPQPAMPSVDPGELVTGLPAYLVLDGEQTISASESIAGITISVSGEASYVIDWGDGTAPTSTSSQGIAYPGGPGEITHTYTSVPAGGAVTITVTTVWTGTSTAGPLPTIERSESITVPLQQIQAVRDR